MLIERISILDDKEIKIYHVESDIPSKDASQFWGVSGPWLNKGYFERGKIRIFNVKGEDWIFDNEGNITAVRYFLRLICPICNGTCCFDVQPPEYDVGITGYRAEYNSQESEHELGCTLEDSDDSIIALEEQAANEYASNPYNLTED